MAGSRRSGGTWVGLTTRKRRSGGTWVDITTAKRRVGGSWVDIFAVEHVVSPDSYGNAVANGPHNFPIASNVTGGIGPFTYAWSWASGGVGMTITNATSVNCNVESIGTDQVRSGTIQCVVTDTGNGNLVRSGTGEITVTHGTPP